MRLRLTQSATRQLDRVLADIEQHNPQGARHVQERLRGVMGLLPLQPFAGRANARRGVRRILASPYPYALTYSVAVEESVILGIRHTVRRPLP